jgi:hypothetical protein
MKITLLHHENERQCTFEIPAIPNKGDEIYLWGNPQQDMFPGTKNISPVKILEYYWVVTKGENPRAELNAVVIDA